MSAPIRVQVPTSPASESSADPLEQVETFDEFSDSDLRPTGSNREVRTLHEPPDIWDLVHETRAEFHPRAAFFARVNPIVLTVLALIVAGVALFGFIRLRGSSGNVSAVPSVVPEESNKKTDPASPATVPANTAVSADQPAPNTPGRSSDATGNSVEPNNTSAANNAVPNPSSNVAAPEALSVKPNVRKLRHADPARSITPISATLASGDNRNKTQQSTTPTPKSDNDPAATVAKKESNKSPGPGLVDPAKTAPTPKAKVIQWP